jgi:thiol-disulfide isomerase/thioredoxin
MRLNKKAILALAICVVLLLGGCAYFAAMSGVGIFGLAASRGASRKPSLGHEQDFAFTLFEGKREARLSDYVGQPVVLNFWADWCPPCVGELPEFNEVYAARKGQFVLLAVAVQSAQNPEQFVQQAGLKLDFAHDTGNGAELYGVQGIPTTLFIDRQGNIVDKVVGGMDKATFEEKLAAIL